MLDIHNQWQTPEYYLISFFIDILCWCIIIYIMVSNEEMASIIHRKSRYNQILRQLEHDKTNKMTCAPSKTKISLGICPVLLTHWVAIQADSKDWSNFADAQADQSSLTAYVILHVFVVLWLKRDFVRQKVELQYFSNLTEPYHEKTCLQGLRPNKTQTDLLSWRALARVLKFRL